LTLLLGVDLGTTAIKAGLYAANGDLVASATSEQRLSTPAPGVVELDLDPYWQGFVDVVRQVVQRAPGGAATIVGLALSVQGETLVAADRGGRALRPAIVWLDNRATVESEQLQDRFGDETVFKVTGQTEMLPTWPAPKILWVRNHEPTIFGAVEKWLLLEDYFIQRLTGEPWCEGSLVTSTCYWDLQTQTWWPEMLEAIGIGESQLPRIGESGTAVGSLRRGVADELGLDHRTVVSLGALDQACGAIGVGNIATGIFSENTGGALAVCATVDHPVLDPNRRIPCHAHGLAGLYMLHTFTSGGIVLRWWRDEFARAGGHHDEESVGYEEMMASAGSVPPGAEGVMVVPHLQGAMAPDPNPHATAAITGLRLHHGPPHVVRAILESIAYVVRRNLDAIADMGLEVHEIRALGGGARSPLWKQIEASVTGVPVVVTSCAEPATLGAAVLAGLGAGVFGDVGGAISSAVRTAARYEPDVQDRAVYQEGYARYCELSETLGQFSQRPREVTCAT
jgi:sugar (pentulose or hexulose) kinase